MFAKTCIVAEHARFCEHTESTKLKKAAGDAFWAAVDFFIPPA